MLAETEKIRINQKKSEKIGFSGNSRKSMTSKKNQKKSVRNIDLVNVSLIVVERGRRRSEGGNRKGSEETRKNQKKSEKITKNQNKSE